MTSFFRISAIFYASIRSAAVQLSVSVSIMLQTAGHSVDLF